MSWYSAKNSYRRGARNVHHKQAQSRIHQARDTFRERISNSLQVEGHDCFIFHRLQVATPCSCRQVVKDAAHDTIPDQTVEFQDTDFFGDGTGTARKADSIGISSDNELPGSTEIEINDLLSGRDPTLEDRSIDDKSIACGICYSEGYIPPFALVGHTYETITPFEMEINQYTLNQATQPSTLEAIGEEASVSFELFIPYDTQQISYAVRNNLDILTDCDLLYNGNQVTRQDIIQNIGKTMKFTVVGPLMFTHVSMMFTSGSVQKVNCSALSSSIDYESMYNIQSLNLVLPHNYCHVSSGDYVYIKPYNLMVKVNDVTPKHDAENKVFEYSAGTRVCQPSEIIRSILDLDKIY